MVVLMKLREGVALIRAEATSVFDPRAQQALDTMEGLGASDLQSLGALVDCSGVLPGIELDPALRTKNEVRVAADRVPYALPASSVASGTAACSSLPQSYSLPSPLAPALS